MKEPLDPFPEDGSMTRALEAVRNAFEKLEDSEIRDLLRREAHRFLDQRQIEAPPSYQFYGGQLGWTTWVVRNDQVDAVNRFAPVAAALSTALSLAAGQSLAPTATALVMYVVVLATRAKRKLSTPDILQFQVLMTLRAAGPCTLVRLVDLLNTKLPDGLGLWRTDELRRELASLKSNRSRDGQLEPLVVVTGEGTNEELWSANGV